MKLNLVVILEFLVFLEINSQSQCAFTLIVNYLKQFNIKCSYFLTCWAKSENMKLIRMMTEADIQHSFLKSDDSVKQSLKEKNLSYYGYILDSTCKKFSNTFLSENITRCDMRIARPWLIFGRNSTSVSVWETIFRNVSIRMDSNVKLAVPLRKQNMIKILDIYNPGLQVGHKPIISTFGYWNGSNLNVIKKTSTFFVQRKNMTSVRLRSGSVVLVSNHSGNFEEYMLDTRHTQLDTMSKFHYSMFLLLKDVHHFSHTVQIENKWFGNYQNGTDAGVGRLLYDNKIDITCTGASQRPPRIDAYDYLMPSYHFRPCYIFRNPGSYDPLSDEFLKPFSVNVWYATICSVILISIFLKIFHRTESKFVGSRSFRYSWVAAVLTSLSVIFQQADTAASFLTGYAGRIVFLVLQVLSLLLYNYYTSSIISSLLSKPPAAFNTLDELGHSKLEIGIEDLPYTITWFEIMNDSDVQYIYRKKVLAPGAKHLNIFEPEEGIAKVGKGGFAYHTQLDTGYPIIAKTFDQDAICDVTEIPMIPQVEAGIMVQKISQYKELFHITLRMAKQAGLVHRVSQIWESKKPPCLSNARVIAVGTDQVFIAFLTLFVGMGLSILFLILEIIWFRQLGRDQLTYLSCIL